MVMTSLGSVVTGSIGIRFKDLLAHKLQYFWGHVLSERDLPASTFDADRESGDQFRFPRMRPITTRVYRDMIHNSSFRMTPKRPIGLPQHAFLSYAHF
jgi:hypothetical protein